MTEVVLGVGGGIAAYKSCELLRLFTESGHDVRVVPTAAALKFVGAPTWAALSGRPVATEVWDDVHEVPHVRLGQPLLRRLRVHWRLVQQEELQSLAELGEGRHPLLFFFQRRQHVSRVGQCGIAHAL